MPEVEEHEHEHHSSGIAKAGLTTGIIGTALSTINAMASGAGILGGGNRQQDQINALRDENILLKANAQANEKIHNLELTVVKQGEQITAMRNEFTQALNYEFSARQQSEANLKQ